MSENGRVACALSWELFDALEDGVVLLDGAGTVVALNRSLCRLFGVDQSTVVGRPLASLDCVGGGGWVEPLLSRLQQQGNEPVQQRRYFCRSGSEERFEADLTGVSVEREEGEPQLLLSFCDRSEVNLLEQSQREAAYHGGISEITAHFLHSFGNVITAVRFYIDSLGEAESKLNQLAALLHEEEAREEAGEPRRISSNALATALEEFVQIFLGDDLRGARLGVDEMVGALDIQRSLLQESAAWCSDFSLLSLIENATILFQRRLSRSGVELVVNHPEQFPMVHLPLSSMQQLVIILVKNGIESIEARCRQHPAEEQRRQIHCLLESPARDSQGQEIADQVDLVIEDSGIDIATFTPTERATLCRGGAPLVGGRSSRGLNAGSLFLQSIGGALLLEEVEGGGSISASFFPSIGRRE